MTLLSIISLEGGEYIGRKCAPIKVLVYYPSEPAGQQELARRVASVHADAVDRKLQKLTCPTQQKLQLLSAVVHTVKDEVVRQGP